MRTMARRRPRKTASAPLVPSHLTFSGRALPGLLLNPAASCCSALESWVGLVYSVASCSDYDSTLLTVEQTREAGARAPAFARESAVPIRSAWSSRIFLGNSGATWILLLWIVC